MIQIHKLSNKHICIFIILLLSSIYTAKAQKPVKISNEKVVIEGTIYYIHTVKKGETLYSISKAYNVPEKVIAEENSGVLYGLQVGQALKIPAEGVRKNDGTKDTTKYIYHQVKAGQTPFFLSQKYQVPIDLIYQFNPDAQDGLRINQQIIIPRDSISSKSQESPYLQPTETAYKIHIAAEDETLYSLSKNYGISQDSLMIINPDLVDGLKEGMELKIPVSFIPEGSPLPDTNIIQTRKPSHKEPYIFHCQPDRDFDKIYKIAIILPLDVKRYLESLQPDTTGLGPNPTPEQLKASINPKSISHYFDFYDGILLAADSLKKLGFKCKIHVYDTEKSPDKTQKIAKEIRKLKPDIIFGPVFRSNVTIISEVSKDLEIPLVSPLSTDPSLINTNPYLFQVVPSNSVCYNHSASYLLKYADSNLLFVHNGDLLSMEDIHAFRDEIFEEFAHDNKLYNLVFKEVPYIDSLNVNLELSLVKDKPNVVIIPMTKVGFSSSRSVEGFASKVLAQLDLLKDEYDIKVFGTSEFQRFTNIDLSYFHNQNLSIFTPFYIDYSAPHLINFFEKYSEIFETEPYETSSKGYNITMLGYDAGFYFMNALRVFGSSFVGCIENYHVPLTLSDYDFKRKDVYSGFENTSVYIINYTQEYKIKKEPIDLF
jgi:LysM repeat protein